MKKGNPYSNDSDLNKFKQGDVKKDDGAKDDGKPHKAKKEVVDLNSESSKISQKNQSLQQKIEENRRKVASGEIQPKEVPDSVFDGIPKEDVEDVKNLNNNFVSDQKNQSDIQNSISTIESTASSTPNNNSLTQKKTEMKDLLNNKSEEEKDDYRDKSFKYELVLELPPKRVLNMLQEYSTFDVSDELGKMMFNKILTKIENDELFNDLRKLAESYMGTKK